MLASVASPEFLGVILLALVVIFGGSQLPKIARNVGSAGREFRKAQREAEEDEAKKAQLTPAVTAGPPVVVTPVPAAPVAAQPVPAVDLTDDKVTISKAELAALLDERLGRGNGPANSASTNRSTTNEAGGFNN